MYNHRTENHHDPQPEKRRRPEFSTQGPPPSKTLNRQTTAITPAKATSLVAVTRPALSAPTATPASSPVTIPGIKGSSTSGKTTREPLADNPVDPNPKAGDSTSPKPSQAASILLPAYGKSTLRNGDETIPDSLPSTTTVSIGDGECIPNMGEHQVMLPPTRIEKDTVDGAVGDYEPNLHDILCDGVDIVENIHKRKGLATTPPRRKRAKFTAMVSLDSGTSEEVTEVFVTIAKNGPNTRFEVTQRVQNIDGVDEVI